jgi:hypothetical protein
MFFIAAISQITDARITRESIDDCEDLGTVGFHLAHTVWPHGHSHGHIGLRVGERRGGRSWFGCL